MRYRPTVAVDFDGVIHKNQAKWTHNSEVNDGPVPGAKEAIKRYISAGYEVVIVSSRALLLEGQIAIERWLQFNGFPRIRVTHEKVGAKLYIDDCGFHFTGEFPPVEYLDNFVPWHKKPGEEV